MPIFRRKQSEPNSIQRSNSEQIFENVVPKKQVGRKRSKSFNILVSKKRKISINKLSQSQDVLEGLNASYNSYDSRSDDEELALHDQIYRIDNMSQEQLLDLTYRIIIEIKGIKKGKMLRRRSCDTELFGGQNKTSLDFKIKEDKPFDILMNNYVVEKAKKIGRKITEVKLPWYLDKNTIHQRISSLRMLIQNMMLKKFFTDANTIPRVIKKH